MNDDELSKFEALNEKDAELFMEKQIKSKIYGYDIEESTIYH